MKNKYLFKIRWTELGKFALKNFYEVQGTNYYDNHLVTLQEDWIITNFHNGEYWTAGRPAFITTIDEDSYFYFEIRDFADFWTKKYFELIDFNYIYWSPAESGKKECPRCGFPIPLEFNKNEK